MINFVNFVLFHIQEGQNIQDHLMKLLEKQIYLVKMEAKEIILLGQNVNAYNFLRK